MQFSHLWPGPEPQLDAEVFAARRKRVAKQLGDAALVVATHPVSTYSNDVEDPYRPHSDFWYLTGFDEPESVLVLHAGGSTLFLRQRDRKKEVWTGRRLGVERADLLGVDEAYPIEELEKRLPGLVGDNVCGSIQQDPRVEAALSQHEVADGTGLLAAMRCIKDAGELRLMQKAADVGVAAMQAAAKAIRSGSSEAAVEGILHSVYRASGSTGAGYPPIVGAGKNAAVLHYIRNQDPIQDGRPVLIDAGCEWGYYNSDITRTFPCGRFTDTQAALYDIVLEAHEKALAKVCPGNRFKEPHEAAVQVLAEGLVELGYLDGPVEDAVQNQTYRDFYMHGTSHLLGLDVHDAIPPRAGEPLRLEEGMVLTVEPGLYFNRDYADCPKEAADLGIRIENDVAVTEDGMHNLTAALSIQRDAVEAMVA